MLPQWSRWAWLRSTALGASVLNEEVSRSEGMRSRRYWAYAGDHAQVYEVMYPAVSLSDRNSWKNSP
jgi:hypothetical protein